MAFVYILDNALAVDFRRHWPARELQNLQNQVLLVL